ncbi:MAG: HXXEE domain-containing protein [Polyangiaceae bacterium]
MKRLLFASICVYVPHLAEEYFTRMYDDPIVAFALAPVESWSPRHAAYLVFQIMLVLSLAMTLAFAAGRPSQNLVMLVLAFSLVCESHHAVRWILSHHYNSGLVTSFPMPLYGLFIASNVFRKKKESPSCSTTSFSPWASDESSSA